jgi:hypothetical protein
VEKARAEAKALDRPAQAKALDRPARVRATAR